MKELGDFQEKTKTGNKEDLYSELMELDKKAQAKQQQKSAMKTAFGEEEVTHQSPDKRL